MTWTTPGDLRRQLERWWDKGLLLEGQLLAESGLDEAAFPRRLTLKTPNSAEITTQFDAVRRWAEALQAMPHIRLEYREFSHRIFGQNRLPAAAWLDRAEDAGMLLGKRKEQKLFAQILALTANEQPKLLPWLHKRPLRALDYSAAWEQLLAVVAWLQAHPRPAIYLRQIDQPGIDSKFVEAHRAVLTELLDLALPTEAIDDAATGISGFNRRYGFLDKPERIRCRFLDPASAPAPWLAKSDLTLDSASFAALEPAVDRVFMTENEINFLAFPAVDRSLLIFGAGYGFSALDQADWLHKQPIYYWGDIDTHGFAILNELRGHFPQVQSLLMDSATLLAHCALWGHESSPIQHDLPRLTPDESQVYDTLRQHSLANALRLEQERIPLAWLREKLQDLTP
jgi:hypothetical protein